MKIKTTKQIVRENCDDLPLIDRNIDVKWVRVDDVIKFINNHNCANTILINDLNKELK